MKSPWLTRTRSGRLVCLALCLLGLGHLPMPVADFHEVRHHDEPGQVCRLHDHLLRWHPRAGATEAVHVLHWHWLPPGSASDGSSHHDEGPLVHAHAPDFLGPTWEDGGFYSLVRRTGLEIGPDTDSTPLRLLDAAWTDFALSRAGPSSIRAFTATFSPRVCRTALLQRWNC